MGGNADAWFRLALHESEIDSNPIRATKHMILADGMGYNPAINAVKKTFFN
jgi:hypothetical protein